MKILIIRFSSIGDIVLTSPVVRCLHEQKDAEIHYLTKRAFTPLLNNNIHIYKVWEYTEEPKELFTQLQAEQFDYVIDLHHNLRSAKIKRILDCPSKSFYKANVPKWLMTNFKINRLPKEHIVHRYMGTVSELVVNYDGKGLDFHINNEDRLAIKRLLPKKYIAIAIGAAHATKVPPYDFFLELCKGIQLPLILVGGPNDAAKGNRLSKEGGNHITNMAGELSLGESAAVIEQADWLITPDTGMMHIAAALQKNIISIWGSTIPEFGMYPFFPDVTNGRSIIIENKGLSCRPCSKIGYDICPKKHFNCMDKDNILKILKVINKGNFDINSQKLL